MGVVRRVLPMCQSEIRLIKYSQLAMIQTLFNIIVNSNTVI